MSNINFSITLPDSTFAELTFADCGSGPDNCFSRQHLNTNAVFCRFNGGNWLHYGKQMHKARSWLELSESIFDAMEYCNVL